MSVAGAPRTKRRRSNVFGTPANKAEFVPPDIWSLEEDEASSRDPEKDQLLFKQACGNIRRIMKEVLDLKKTKNSSAEVSEKQVQASLLFLLLKKLNRLEKIRNRKVRDATNLAKQKVDTHHLQLQNLLYEVTHLTKEVNKCLDFKSKDEEIELIPLEEFYKEAPVEISKPTCTRNHTHEQTLARLDWELEQRKRLAAKCKKAEKEKEVLLRNIRLKKECLETVSPCLSSILQATIPVQEQLGVQQEMTHSQNKTASYLPTPLFILYVQSCAYAEAWGETMDVSIEGDVDEGRAMNNTEEDQDDDSGDSDQEESTGDKRYRRNTTDKITEKRRKILQKHPLCVTIIMSLKDASKLKLNFCYLVTLRVVTVTSELSLASELQTPSCDVLGQSVLLDSLFLGDSGFDTPNKANNYLLKRWGMDDFSSYVSELGRPFLWAQRLAGLDFVQCQATNEPPNFLFAKVAPSADVSSSHMELVVRAIKQRLCARTSLQKQLLELDRGSIPVPVEMMRLFPAKVSTRLASWSSMAWDDYKVSRQAAKLIDCGLVSQEHFTFSSVFERGSAHLSVLVAVSPHYPLEPPLFAVSLPSKDAKSNFDEAAFLDMEKEVNVYWPEMLTNAKQPCDCLLGIQMYRLAVCFDVYLEMQSVVSAAEGPNEFAKENIFLQLTKGRSRGKPYKFMHQLGLFSHR